MHYLVIASGKYCERYKVIKSGSYEELSKYTVKFYNSSEIRKNNKLIISDFSNTYKINGDIVIMDENNNRVRVLYKNDVKLVKELIKSQNLLKYLVSHNMLIVSDYDYKAIMYYKNKDYLKHMKDFLTRKKSYYNIIRIIIRGYEKYQKKHKELPSLYCLEKEFIDNNNKMIKDKNIIYGINNNIKNEEFYNRLSDSLNYGGYEEIFNNYSLDELGANLYYDDFKNLVKSDCRT